MKTTICAFVLAASSALSSQTTFYVSTAGNDANAGTSPASAWRTLAKVESMSFAPGDQILLRRGEVWREALTARRSQITIGAFGSGSRPKISGADLLTGWTSVTQNVYSVRLTAKAEAVYFDGKLLRPDDGAAANVEVGEWDWRRNVLYLNVGGDPADRTVEASVRLFGVSLGYEEGRDSAVKDSVTLQDLHIEKSYLWGIDAVDSQRSVFQRLEVAHISPGRIAGGNSPVGIGLNHASQNNLVQDCEIHDIKKNSRLREGSAIYVGTTASRGTHLSENNRIRNNHIYNCAVGTNLKYSTGSGHLVEGNDYHDFGNRAIEAVRNNTIRYNRIHDINNPDENKTASGIECFSGNRIHHNLFHNVEYSIVVIGPTTGMEARMDGGDDNHILNNTVVGGTVFLQLLNMSGASTKGNRIQNNLVAGTFAMVEFARGTYTDLCTFDHNCYYNPNKVRFLTGSSFRTFDEWKDRVGGGGQEANSILLDPAFVNRELGDFNLRDDSPCLDAGMQVSLERDIQGRALRGAPDIGAFELSSVLVAGSEEAAADSDLSPARVVRGADGLTYSQRRETWRRQAFEMPNDSMKVDDRLENLFLYLENGIYNSAVEATLNHMLQQWAAAAREPQLYGIVIVLKYGSRGKRLISDEIERKILERYAKMIGEGNGFGGLNPNKNLLSVAGMYLYCLHFNRTIQFPVYGMPSQPAVSRDHYARAWDSFKSRNGQRSYSFDSGPYKALNLCRDYLKYRFDDWYLKGNWEFDSQTYHLHFTNVAIALAEMSTETAMRTQGNMVAQLMILDFAMDQGLSNLSGTLGRTDYRKIAREAISTTYNYLGLGEVSSRWAHNQIPFIYDWQPLPVVVDAGTIHDEPDDYFHFHMENHALGGDDSGRKNKQGKGKWNFVTPFYGLGSNVGARRSGWLLTVNSSRRDGSFLRLWSTDRADAAPPKSEGYYLGRTGRQYRRWLFDSFASEGGAARPRILEKFNDPSAWDAKEEKQGVLFRREGRVFVAVLRSGKGVGLEVAVQGIDYPDYGGFKRHVLANASVTDNSYTTGTNGVVLGPDDWCGLDSKRDCNFPFKRMETIDNTGAHIIDWNNEVMTVRRHGREAVFDFKRWTLTTTDTIPPPAPPENAPPRIQPIASQTVAPGELLELVVVATDDHSTPSLTAGNLASGMNFSDRGDGAGRLTWRPLAEAAHEITFVATDSDGLTDRAQVTIAARAAGPSPPRITPIPDQFVNLGDSLAFDVVATDDKSILSLAVSNLLEGMIFIVRSGGIGNFGWRPATAGAYQVRFTAIDTDKLTDEIDVAITVQHSASGPPGVTPPPGQLAHKYPRIGVYRFGEPPPPEFLARYDLVNISNIGDPESINPELVRRIKAIDATTLVFSGIDWNSGRGLDGQSLVNPKFRTLNSSGGEIVQYRKFKMANFSRFSGKRNGQPFNKYLPAWLMRNYDQTAFDGHTTNGSYVRARAAEKDLDIDLDGDGVNDFDQHGRDWVTEQWRNGLIAIVDEINRLNNNRPVILNSGRFHHENENPPYVPFRKYNGVIKENSYLVKSPKVFIHAYDQFMRKARAPHLLLIDARSESLNDFRHMRFVLGMTLYGDGYMSLQENGEHHYHGWYDEYDTNLGDPLGAMIKIRDTGLNERGVYFRPFSKGCVILNLGDTPQVVRDEDINQLAGYGGTYFRFQGGQQPRFNDGREFNSITLEGEKVGNKILGDAILLFTSPTTFVSDIILDSEKPGVHPGSERPLFSGTWQKSINHRNAWFASNKKHKGYFALRFAEPNSGATAKFVPTIGVAGQYRVYEWHGAELSLTHPASHVPVVISDRNGSQPAKYNAAEDQGQWNYLGTFDFAKGKSGYLKVLTNGANGQVVVDAFKFEFVGNTTSAVSSTSPGS